MGDRQPVSKVEEFEALCDALRDAKDDTSAKAAATALLLYHANNRDLIARALRRDDIVSDDALEAVSRSTGYATYVVKQIIDTFREAVR